jgi:hypothetical protein
MKHYKLNKKVQGKQVKRTLYTVHDDERKLIFKYTSKKDHFIMVLFVSSATGSISKYLCCTQQNPPEGTVAIAQ